MDFRGPPEGTERAPGEVCGSQGVSSGGAGFEDLGIWLPSIGDQCKGSGAKALVNFAVLKGPGRGHLDWEHMARPVKQQYFWGAGLRASGLGSQGLQVAGGKSL